MSALAGRFAVVTGASRGIGAAVARSLAAAGADLLLVARTVAPLESVARELGAQACTADVSDPEQVARVAAAARRQHGVPDVVVHAAGAFALAPVTDTSVDTFDRMLAVNLRAAFLLMREFLGAMIERGSGHVVSIGSAAGRQVFPHNGAYAAAKYGLRGLHGVLAAELAGTGVTATLVEPGATDTPLWDAIDFAATPGLPPRADMLRPEAVADAVLFAITRPHTAAVHNIILNRN